MTDTAALSPPRYIYAESWGHFFDDRSAESEVRWIWDRAAAALIHVDVRTHDGWRIAAPDEQADVLADVMTNSDCLDDPAEWGIEASDSSPCWGPSQHEMMRRARAAFQREAAPAAEDRILERWDDLQRARLALEAALAGRLARDLPAGAVLTPGAPGPSRQMRAAAATAAATAAAAAAFRLDVAATLLTDGAGPAAWRWRASATAVGSDGTPLEIPPVILDGPILSDGEGSERDRLALWLANAE